VAPGVQTIALVWQQPWERTLKESMPPVHIGSKAVNATLNINLGDDRWLLWVAGPSWGPAVLYWSHLLILLVAAMLLGRLKKLPVKTYEWLLLALGMAQLPVVVMLLPVGWFIALAWRERKPIEAWWKFDGYQIALVFMTFIAMGSLYAAIHANLLFDVDMQVKGAGSSNHLLGWYVDHVDGALPEPSIISLPLLVWRIGMLVWALWLVSRLLKWVPWGWRAFSRDLLWRSPPPREPRPPRGGFTPSGSAPPGGGGVRRAPPVAADPEPVNSELPTEEFPREAEPTTTACEQDVPEGEDLPSGGPKTYMGLAAAHLDELELSAPSDDPAESKRRLASGTREAMLRALRDRKGREGEDGES
jgi:hypothetical protein